MNDRAVRGRVSRTMSPELRVLVVFAVLGILLVLGLMVFAGGFERGTYRTGVGSGPTPKNRAKLQMRMFGEAITHYRASHGELPAGLQELVAPDPRTGEPIIESIPLDPWGGAYVYRRTADGEYRILSTGEDRQEGTEDDVVWRPE